MWSSIQFLFILSIIIISFLSTLSSLPEFAVYSEALWLICYAFTSVLGSFIDSPEILSFPFIILVLTAVEAVIVWSLISLSRAKL